MALSGMESTSGAMFNFAGGPSTLSAAPSAAEMEAAAQAVLFKKTVVFERIEIRTYDLSKAEDVKEYAKLLKALYTGVQAKTHLILQHDKKFVEHPDARWLAHIEWAEYSLKVEENKVLKPAGDTHGQAGT